MDNLWNLPQLAATHPAFREMSEYIKKEHLKRRPAIDKFTAKLRAGVEFNFMTFSNDRSIDVPYGAKSRPLSDAFISEEKSS